MFTRAQAFVVVLLALRGSRLLVDRRGWRPPRLRLLLWRTQR
jgi:hypothetical protein